MIPVTKPFMPPKEEYEQYLDGIWKREYLTNNGQLLQQLEKRLVDYLDIEYLSLVSNGTLALQIALKALDIKGEVITTPFSFVATTSSIIWEGNTPVFVDINPQTFNIDADRIEQAITDKTSAILATHVYGNPCDIDAIRKIADRYNLKVIYDAAHCFGTRYDGSSVFQYGDISVTSFHATKLFHTVEGGAMFARSEEVHKRINSMRNFGHDGPGNFNGIGINAKNSELHAAMGLCNLGHIEGVLERRKQQWLYYNDILRFVNTKDMAVNPRAQFNYAYYPLVFDSEELMLEVKNSLEKEEIYPRRYFYPSLNELDYTEDIELYHSERVARCVLCLPLYHELRAKDQDKIAKIINKFELAKVS